MENYNPKIIEGKWQKVWDEKEIFSTPEETSKNKKYYILEMFPYPSGNIHMGHVRNYTLGDVLARFYISNGYDVLHPMGWDSFGMPAENAAIENKVSPKSWTIENINNMRAQLKRIGFAIDWKREISTCSSEYYKHQQKFFIDFFNKNLAYKKDSTVNWDPVDKTVLANEQVIDGKGWRSGATIVKKKLSQWFLRISDFSDELINDLEQLKDWPDKVKYMQNNWIGRSFGAEISFKLSGQKSKGVVKVFSTKPETIFGATFIALSFEHPLANEFTKDPSFVNFKSKYKETLSKNNNETTEKIGYKTNFFALHPFIENKKIPVYFANFVLMEYGTGAIFGCPGHDERDYEFAKKYNIEIIQIMESKNSNEKYSLPVLNENNSKIINSSFLNNLNIKDAREKILNQLTEKKIGIKKTKFKLRDWGISRQRYWGCPVPILYREDGKIIPVSENNLPVELPEDIDFSVAGNPLDKHPTWKYTKCPQTGLNAIRETDTLDTFVDSSWYFLRFCDPQNIERGFSEEKIKKWMPVDQYIGGIEHAILHLLYSRFFMRSLKKCKYNVPKEPFKSLLTQGMVCHETFKTYDNKWIEPNKVFKHKDKYFTKDGTEVTKGRSEKMSKSKKNVIDPENIVNKYGADTARLFMMSDSPPERDLEWSEEGIKATWKYLNKIYSFLKNKNFKFLVDDDLTIDSDEKYKFLIKETHEVIKNYTEDIKNYKFNSAVAKIREFSNKLFSNEKMPEKIYNYTWSIFLRLIYVFTPHFSEELCDLQKSNTSICNCDWPQHNDDYLNKKNINLVVQVNGKKKTLLEVPINLGKRDVEVLLKKSQKTKDIFHLKIKKIIFIKDKIINFVVG